MRNPKWHRDEIILALDLYFKPDRGVIDARNPNIIQLSQELNQLPIFSYKQDEATFRNPNGVGLKLSNFLAIDPEHGGKGMQAYSKLDKEVFDEFANDRQRLHTIAERIREVLNNEPLRQSISYIEEDENEELDMVQEGQVLYRLHKYRERNASIVAAKKNAVLKATGSLACEACAFDFFYTYGQLGYGFIECHHTKPLSFYTTAVATKLSDLALVCSNCHQMLHRQPGAMGVGELKERIRK